MRLFFYTKAILRKKSIVYLEFKLRVNTLSSYEWKGRKELFSSSLFITYFFFIIDIFPADQLKTASTPGLVKGFHNSRVASPRQKEH